LEVVEEGDACRLGGGLGREQLAAVAGLLRGAAIAEVEQLAIEAEISQQASKSAGSSFADTKLPSRYAVRQPACLSERRAARRPSVSSRRRVLVA
jgi:hypothetical protein